MARRNRSNGLEMNFDGLADSVTNLVGALILLVVMIIGLSKDAVSAPDAPPPLRPGGEGADKPVLPLKQRIALLEAEVSQVDSCIRQLHGRLEPLKQEVEELLKQVDSVQPQPKEEKKPSDETTVDVPYRPPFERLDTRTTVGFVIEENRISFLDYREVGETLKKKLVAALEKNPNVRAVPIEGELPGSDFRLEGKVNINRVGENVSLSFELQVFRRPDALGEPLADALKPDSRYRRALAALDPKQIILEFVVYPDSYAPFRNLRQLAWENNFDLSWSPKSSGGQITLSRGVGTVN